MKDLTIIIPVPKYSEKVGKLLNRALESCGDTNKILVGEGVTEFLENNSGKKDLKNLEVIAMTQESSYQHNVNVAVDSVTTKYFSVIEYDDFILISVVVYAAPIPTPVLKPKYQS